MWFGFKKQHHVTNVPEHFCPQHVPGSATTVTIPKYTVRWWQEGKNTTEQKESEHTETEVSIGPGQYNFTVEAILHRSLSIPAHIAIPKMDTRGEQILLVLYFKQCRNKSRKD